MSTSELASIINQLDQAVNKNPWYGNSISNILESVDSDFAFNPPAPGIHSIAELTAHIITWREFAEKRLQGDDQYLPDQEESFNWKKRYPEQDEAWIFLRQQLTNSQYNLLALLHQNDDCLLERKVSGTSYSYRFLLNGILQHDLYHIGQISLIEKMHQGKQLSNPKFPDYNYRLFSFENLSLTK